jgi:transcriptional regulator with XRE-family HTH domain
MAARPPVNHRQDALLAELGERLRLMRLRRRMSAQTLASLAGITRTTLHRLEAGDAAATLGTLLKVMGVLQAEGDVSLLALDDHVGQKQADAQLRPRRLPSKIRLRDLPQLREAAWHMPAADVELTPQEAFELYERNWRHIDRAAMGARETRLLEQLTKHVGKGVLLV